MIEMAFRLVRLARHLDQVIPEGASVQQYDLNGLVPHSPKYGMVNAFVLVALGVFGFLEEIQEDFLGRFLVRVVLPDIVLPIIMVVPSAHRNSRPYQDKSHSRKRPPRPSKHGHRMRDRSPPHLVDERCFQENVRLRHTPRHRTGRNPRSKNHQRIDPTDQHEPRSSENRSGIRTLIVSGRSESRHRQHAVLLQQASERTKPTHRSPGGAQRPSKD